MKNSFKVRVVENIGGQSQIVFGKVGTIISVENGIFRDEQNDYWDYDSYESMINDLSEHDCYETKFELLEDDYMECKFKIGDLVKVTDVCETYSRFDTFVSKKCHQYEDDFISGDMPSEKETYKVVYYGEHLNDENNDRIVVIQDLDTDQIYLVSEQGLELVTPIEDIDEINITTTRTVFDESKLKQFQPIKIKGKFAYTDDDVVTAIIADIDSVSMRVVYVDDDGDEESHTILLNEIINREYEIIKLYK